MFVVPCSERWMRCGFMFMCYWCWYIYVVYLLWMWVCVCAVVAFFVGWISWNIKYIVMWPWSRCDVKIKFLILIQYRVLSSIELLPLCSVFQLQLVCWLVGDWIVFLLSLSRSSKRPLSSRVLPIKTVCISCQIRPARLAQIILLESTTITIHGYMYKSRNLFLWKSINFACF
jgi:hypothetical protein